MQVVAPVRETCGQLLGYLLKHVADPSVFHKLATLFLFLMGRKGTSSWDLRYGGYLGIKYLLASKPGCSYTSPDIATVFR